MALTCLTMVARTALAGGTPVFRFSLSGCPEELRVVRFSGQEGLSSLFEFELELACNNVPRVERRPQ